MKHDETIHIILKKLPKMFLQKISEHFRNRRIALILTATCCVSAMLIAGAGYFIAQSNQQDIRQSLAITTSLLKPHIASGLLYQDSVQTAGYLQQCLLVSGIDHAVAFKLSGALFAAANTAHRHDTEKFPLLWGTVTEKDGIWQITPLKDDSGNIIGGFALHAKGPWLYGKDAEWITPTGLILLVLALMLVLLLRLLYNAIMQPLTVVSAHLKGLENLPLNAIEPAYQSGKKVTDVFRELNAMIERVNAVALQNSSANEQLLSTLSSMDDMVLVLNNEMIIADAYLPAGSLPFQVSSVISGMPLEVIFPRATAQQLIEHIVRNHEQPVTTRFDYQLEFSGSVTSWSAKISPRRDAHGQRSGVTIVSRNITPDKLREETIRYHEELFHNFIQQSAEGLLIADNTGMITEWNRAMEELTGFTCKATRGRYIWDIQYGMMESEKKVMLTKEQLKAGILKMLADGQSEFFYTPTEITMIGQDGRELMVNQITFPIKTSKGLFLGAILRDVTERKYAQLLLAEKEKIMRTVIDAAPYGAHVWRLAPGDELLFVYANKSADILLKMEHAKYFGKRIEEVYEEGDSIITKQPIVALIKSQQQRHIPTYEIGFRSITYILELHSVPISETEVVFFFRDIAEQKEAQRALETANTFIQQVINSIPVAIISLDGSGCIQMCNAGALGYTSGQFASQELVGQPFFTAFPSLIFLKEYLQRVTDGGGSVNETVSRKKEAGVVEYHAVAILPLQQPDAEGYLILLEDVTHEKMIDQFVIQSEKLASLGELSAGMAHELNNPLGTIVQGCQNILRRTSGDLQKNIETGNKIGVSIDKVNRYLEERQIYTIINSMQDAVRKASDIISNMLQFSRKSESKLSPQHLPDLMDNALNLIYSDYDFKKKYDFKNFAINKSYQEKLPRMYVNANEIEQVFLNILKNSAQAIKGWSQKTEYPEINIHIFLENGYIVTEIADNGPGVSESVRMRIFEPFFTTKEIGEGTGLGLSVSYSIITNNHNGRILVESEEGAGAIFKIYLPIVNETPV